MQQNCEKTPKKETNSQSQNISQGKALHKSPPGLTFVDPKELTMSQYKRAEFPAADRPKGFSQYSSQPIEKKAPPKPWSKASLGMRDSFDEHDDSAFAGIDQKEQDEVQFQYECKTWSKRSRGQRDSYDDGDDSAFFGPSTSK
ncbi:hypothetical protein niasHS_016398 [Heterodera schachtii]|uniref:Uncharacterized protein n=1 Tax=Heterodera schachtii TaxID=97005 RepID=A0ABD2HNT0_HETSC